MKHLCLIFMLSSTFYSLALAEPLKIGLILDKGGINDKSFNSAAFEGAKRAEKELSIELKYVEATDLNALEGLHRNLAGKGYALIIGVGFAQADAVKKISAQFPKTQFAVVDGEVQGSNVKSLLFEEHEGSFLMGAMAAMKSTSGKVGFIGGMDVPLIRRFALGYSAGVKYVNPKVSVSENFIGVTGEAWNNPAKAKELSLSQFSSGIDVIFVAAGASGSGVFDAAEEKKKFAIGVDSNQNWMKPGIVLTSMLKRVDIAVFETISQLKNGQFKSGVYRYGLKDKGIDYAFDQHNQNVLSAELRKKADDIKMKIIKGDIKVPDYYKNRTSK